MAARKVVAKKTSASKVPVRAKEVELDKEAARVAIESGDASKGGKPKIHAKVVHILVSIGTEDRNRSHEDFLADIKKRLKIVPYGEKGLHGSVTGGYYILDGKVCLPDDYDVKKGTFKPGKVPPTWAGGPKPSVRNLNSREQMEQDRINLSSDAYDKKYQIGKYAPPKPKTKVITQAEQKAKMEQYRLERLRKEEEELEDLEELLDDDAAMEKVSKKSSAAALKKLKSTKTTKRVVKKAAAKKTTGRKVVRRK